MERQNSYFRDEVAETAKDLECRSPPSLLTRMVREGGRGHIGGDLFLILGTVHEGLVTVHNIRRSSPPCELLPDGWKDHSNLPRFRITLLNFV